MRTVLVLGGNGFIGAETVRKLLSGVPDDVRVYLLNRGRSWDWDKRAEILPRVAKCFKWNRKTPLSQCEGVVELLGEVVVVDCVVDFSGYESSAMDNALELLHDKCRLYIYVSTDSVYEVCDKAHPGLSRESDAVLPSSATRRKVMKRRDSYGYKKLRCEERLRHWQNVGRNHDDVSFDYVILRLADVIGPRDSTDRWWQCQLWVMAASACRLPVYLPDKVKDVAMSLVYVKDVANLIARLVTGNEKFTSSIGNEAYNLAHVETCTMQSLMEQIAEAVGIQPPGVTLQYSRDSRVAQVYPSVEMGAVDTSKAGGLLQWEPTRLDLAIQETVTFYDKAATEGSVFRREREEIYESLIEDLEGIYSEEDVIKLRRELHRVLHL